uniref:Putative secreted protein n=1 Tax=Ixodes ricinus TaxID=34613 RepID=V5IIP0_IXORI
MKATLVAICFIAGVVYSMGRLTEQQCRHPVPATLCSEDAKPRTIYYFNNHTNKMREYAELCGRYKPL